MRSELRQPCSPSSLISQFDAKCIGPAVCIDKSSVLIFMGTLVLSPELGGCTLPMMGPE